jgi:hypothetical protein
MLERDYQEQLITTIKRRFPGCIVLKNDSSYLQGFPDLLILHHDMWAVLEVKAFEKSKNQPNQLYYIERLGEMSFSAFIYPENQEEVLSALQSAFQPHRTTRIPKR